MNAQATDDLVTDWEAVNVYSLTNSDIKHLPVQQRKYMPDVPRLGMRCSVQTCLYLKKDIEDAVRWKERRLAIKQQQMAKACRQREKAKAAARDQMLKFSNSQKRARNMQKHGDVKLPDVVLQQIMVYLAAVELDGVRGPSMAANDLANAARVNWDFNNASKHGFAALLEQVKQIKFNPDYCNTSIRQLACLPLLGGWTWQDWNKFICDPVSHTLPSIKEAARQLKLSHSCTKPELILRVLGVFDLKAPCSAPAELLRAVRLERVSTEPWEGIEVLHNTSFILRNLGKAVELVPGLDTLERPFWHRSDRYKTAQLRKLLCAAGVSSKQQLLQLQQDARELLHQRRAQQRKRREAHLKFLEEQAALYELGV